MTISSFSRTLVLLTITTVAACASNSDDGNGSGPSREDASRAMSASNKRLGAASQSIGPGKAALTGTVHVAAPCATSGELAVTGSLDTSTSTGNTKLQLSAAFEMCQEADSLLDGTLTWTGDIEGIKTTNKLQGNLEVTTATGSWQCDFDYSLVVDATGAHATGKVCGYDAATL